MAPGQVAAGVIPSQRQPQAEGQVVPVVPAPGQVGPGVIPGQPQPQAQGQVVPIVPAPVQVAPGAFWFNLNRKRKHKSFLSFRC